MQAYCVKCHAKREMKNGKPATQSVCPVCGTKMFRIGKSASSYCSIGISEETAEESQSFGQTHGIKSTRKRIKPPTVGVVYGG